MAGAVLLGRGGGRRKGGEEGGRRGGKKGEEGELGQIGPKVKRSLKGSKRVKERFKSSKESGEGAF